MLKKKPEFFLQIFNLFFRTIVLSHCNILSYRRFHHKIFSIKSDIPAKFNTKLIFLKGLIIL
jgi:hypothetical protein